MKTSVLINNYNYACFLTETVTSVAEQTHPPHEIIVVDDGSTDHSKEVLEQLRNVFPFLRIHFQENLGQLAAMRAGMQLAVGDWCMFLDADDAWEPEHLANFKKAIAAAPDVSVWYSGHQESEGPPMFRSKWPQGPMGPCGIFVSATGVRVGTITSAIGLRRDIVDHVLLLANDFDADWRIRADDVLLYASAMAGGLFYHSSEPTVRYRIHGLNHFAKNNGLSNSYVEKKLRLFEACRRLYGISEKDHLKLLRRELNCMPYALRSRKIMRKYRRAIRHTNASLADRLLTYISTYIRINTNLK